MSYASVAAHNAPAPDHQPHPDPALLNTSPSSPRNIDDFSKVKVVSPRHEPSRDIDDDDFPPENPDKIKKNVNKRFQEAEAEGLYLLEVTKHYLLQPGVAGGLVGLINIGLLAGIGRAFYKQPHLRRDRAIISSAIAAAVALLSVEGYAAEKYRKSPRGQAEAARAKDEGSLIYKHVREQIFRPKILGGLVGLLNTAILGGVGYLSYMNWDRPVWKYRTVSAAAVGLLTLWGGEGFIIERYSKK